MSLWDAVTALPIGSLVAFVVALAVAFAFEFVNGFHDTANAVTTVIYTRTLKPGPAVLYSGFMNFLGVLLASTAVAFSIVNLLPVSLLVTAGGSNAALVMVLSLLIAALTWNLGTWYLGIPVSSSHSLIGSILGVGIAYGLIEGNGLGGVNWTKAAEVGTWLLLTPLVGFLAGFLALRVMKKVLTEKRLYEPPAEGDTPPRWVRAALLFTCGGVSFAHGSNDGQKGMGLILLVLIGFLPAHYALNTHRLNHAADVRTAAAEIRAALGPDAAPLAGDFDTIDRELVSVQSFAELPDDKRWPVRQAVVRVQKKVTDDRRVEAQRRELTLAVEYVPFWVVVGVAVALGVGTTVGYQRVVRTVAEKIGKTHLTYAQGAAAEAVAMVTILVADAASAPVSTTQILSSGVAGTMVANGSGVQSATVRKIALAWMLTLPSTILLAATLYTIGRWLFA